MSISRTHNARVVCTGMSACRAFEATSLSKPWLRGCALKAASAASTASDCLRCLLCNSSTVICRLGRLFTLRLGRVAGQHMPGREQGRPSCRLVACDGTSNLARGAMPASSKCEDMSHTAGGSLRSYLAPRPKGLQSRLALDFPLWRPAGGRTLLRRPI